MTAKYLLGKQETSDEWKFFQDWCLNYLKNQSKVYGN